MTIATPFDTPNGTQPPAAVPPAAAPSVSAPATPPPAQAGPAPQIVPNRRRLDNQFPILAFTVRTMGRPWFEVLLTTDRTLFDPSAASRRTPSNFYASRQNGGLARAETEDVAYVVPVSVLRGFAASIPRPTEVFYTVAAYAAPDVPPVFAQPVGSLAAGAPSVQLGADYQAHTLATVMGIPAEKLQRVAPAHTPAASSVHTELDDDGIPIGSATSWSSSVDDDTAERAAAQAWAADPHALALDTAPVDVPPTDPTPSQAAMWQMQAPDPEPEPVQQAWTAEAPVADADAAMAYDDGFGTLDDDPYGVAQGVDFPVGAPEPAQLEDDEDHVDADVNSHALDAGYGDEADGYGYAAGGPAALTPAPAPAVAAPPPSTPPAPAPAPAAPAPAPPPATVGARFDENAKIALLHKIGRRFETRQGYRACERDFEFHTPRLPQYERWHVGLTYGFFGFTQDSGALGSLLERFKRADEHSFREIFGPHADELIAVTTARGPESRHVPGGRSARVQPVAGHDLWEDEWVHRFERAGDVPAFQREQDLMAVAYFVDTMLPMAAAFGMDTERAIGMLVDRAGHQGAGGAKRWLLAAMSPLQADAVRQQALAALHFPGVREFQQAHHLHVDGDFGPATHIALAGAVRALGPGSPVPFPTREQLMDAIVHRADQENVWWKRRPHEMRTATEFGDTPLTWDPPAAPASAHHH